MISETDTMMWVRSRGDFSQNPGRRRRRRTRTTNPVNKEHQKEEKPVKNKPVPLLLLPLKHSKDRRKGQKQRGQKWRQIKERGRLKDDPATIWSQIARGFLGWRKQTKQNKTKQPNKQRIKQSENKENEGKREGRGGGLWVLLDWIRIVLSYRGMD